MVQNSQQVGDTMDFHLLGGASRIGRSSTLLTWSAGSILVDAGLAFQGERLPDFDRILDLGHPPEAVLITHAHTDHTGSLPAVHRAFPASPIYMTAPTLDLVRILLLDALKLARQGMAEEALPHWGEEDVLALLERIIPVSASQPVSLPGGAHALWLPAGHILGAAGIAITTPEGTAFFTGDFHGTSQRTVGSALRSQVRADVVITEATYGNRLHADRTRQERSLIEAIAKTLHQGGKVLIPAFAIGRAQEILLILREAIEQHAFPEGTQVVADGMVRDVCDVYAQHPLWVTRSLRHRIHANRHPFWCDNIIRFPREGSREQLAASHTPLVVVASSGMLNGGASLAWFRLLAPDASNAILITGYQDEESPGRAVQNLAVPATTESAQRSLTLPTGEICSVLAQVNTFALSAHADGQQIAAHVTGMNPHTVVLVHGDEDARARLAEIISENSVTNVLAPDDGSTVSVMGRNRNLPSLATQLPLVNLQIPLTQRLQHLANSWKKSSCRFRHANASELAQALGVSDETALQALLLGCGFFEPHPSFPLLWRPQRGESGKMRAPSLLSSDDLLTLARRILPCGRPYRASLDGATFQVKVDFPAAISENMLAQAKVLLVEILPGWALELNVHPRQEAFAEVVRELTKQDPLHVSPRPDEKLVVIEMALDHVNMANVTEEFSVITGWQIRFQVPRARPQCNFNFECANENSSLVSSPRLHFTAARAHILEVFANNQFPPSKVSQQGNRIALRFITPFLAEQQSSLIAKCSQATGYEIYIDNAVDTLAFRNLLLDAISAEERSAVKIGFAGARFTVRGTLAESSAQALHELATQYGIELILESPQLSAVRPRKQ